jgi:transmembrane sensor
MKPDAAWTAAETDPIHVAAAEWLVRLQDAGLSPEDTLAWQEWMKADPRHAAVFSQFEQISDSVGQLQVRATSGQRELSLDHYDGSIPVSQWRPRSAHRGHHFAIAASLLIAVGAVLGSLGTGGFPGLRAAHVKVLTTEVGENRTVPLEDGSRIILGGNSQVEVALSKSVRAIDLQRGEAFFVVAKDPARPFKVRAGSTSITALGTEFNVRRESDRVIVAVTEGRVVVEPESAIVPIALLRQFEPKLHPVHVAAGEETFAGSAGIETVAKQEDLFAATSWQRGQLEFQQQPLKYVLQDVNRYIPKPIVPEDDSVGALIITGTVTRDNVTDWISSLEHAFDLKAVDESDRIVLRRAR